MIPFLLRRLLNYLVLLVLASFLAFCLASLTFHPLDSFIERHPQPPAEAIHAKAVELGLDKPMPIRYAEWAAGVVRGDFGTTVTGHPVAQELWPRVGVSFRLVLIGSLVGTVTGVVLGAWGAVRQYRLSDRVITVLSLIILSIPSFVLAGPAHPGRVAGQQSGRGADFRLHRGNLADSARRNLGPVRRPRAAHRVAESHPGSGRGRELQPIPTQRDAGRAQRGLHPDRAGQGSDAPACAVQTRPAHRADSAGHLVRLRGQRPGRRRGVRREDLRLARHGRVGGAGHSGQDTHVVATITLFTGAALLFAGLLSDIIYAVLDPRVRVS